MKNERKLKNAKYFKLSAGGSVRVSDFGRHDFIVCILWMPLFLVPRYTERMPLSKALASKAEPPNFPGASFKELMVLLWTNVFAYLEFSSQEVKNGFLSEYIFLLPN